MCYLYLAPFPANGGPGDGDFTGLSGESLGSLCPASHGPPFDWGMFPRSAGNGGKIAPEE